jgi:hypothetical protein
MVRSEGYIVETISDVLQTDTEAYRAGAQRRESELRASQANRHFGRNLST